MSTLFFHSGQMPFAFGSISVRWRIFSCARLLRVAQILSAIGSRFIARVLTPYALLRERTRPPLEHGCSMVSLGCHIVGCFSKSFSHMTDVSIRPSFCRLVLSNNYGPLCIHTTRFLTSSTRTRVQTTARVSCERGRENKCSQKYLYRSSPKVSGASASTSTWFASCACRRVGCLPFVSARFIRKTKKRK